MSYETALSIADVIADIHKKEYLLPAIQREFVWNTFQIERLFDSLMRDYPINSFLFWKVEKEKTKEYEFYEFLRNYHERDNQHNPKADTTGDQEVIAVLDGQQRLTSIYLALKGTYAYRLPRKRWNNDNAYPARKLYLNLVSSPSDIEFEYDFRFLTDSEVINDSDNYWFHVGEILTLKEPGDVSEYLSEYVFDDYSKDQRKFANRSLFKLHNVIHEKGSISYYLEKSQELDKVLNIFIRINSGGTILSYSDLLLSIATAQWEVKDAREEIISLVDDLNNIGDGFNFNKDFILKTCLILCDFNDIAFKVDNFNKTNMLKIENEWDNIVKALKIAISLVASFGYSRETLTSNNSIIPIAYYLYKKDVSQNFVSSNRTNSDKEKIKNWLLLSLIKRVFSGQPDNVFRPIRKILQENNSEFPTDKIIEKFKGTNKTLVFSEEDIENLLSYKYGQGFTFSVLSLLYPSLDYRNVFHIDHIHPKSVFTKAKLKRNGISEEKIETYLYYFNYLGNLQLLEATPNIEKRDKDFNSWFIDINDTEEKKNRYKDIHMLPNVAFEFDNFIGFFEKREDILRTKFKEILT